jgi:small subunit ribosomal protein S2
MSDVGLNQLLEAGVHFGHQTRRWNPKMKPFIFTERNGIHIIDLRKTLDRLRIAQQAIREVVLRGDRVLFVCTKKQLRSIVEEEGERCGAFYVTERWLGGMLTNFQTIRKQIRRLKELERGQEENAFEFYTKKERLVLDRERVKLDKYLVGVKDMSRLPGAIFIVDAKREIIAVREAAKLGIPIIAITDTNADPDLVNFPIPGNDDAIRSVSLIAKAIADTIEVARGEVPDEERRRVDDLAATVYSTETGETTEGQAPQRRRPRRKRRPRPEAIAQMKDGEESAAEADSEANVEGAPEGAVEEAATTEAQDATASEASDVAAEEVVVEEAASEDAPVEEAASEDGASNESTGESDSE